MYEKEITHCIERFKASHEITVALVNGSYLHGGMRANSDIDLRFITANSAYSNIKGLCKIENCSFSYLIKTVTDYKKLMASQFQRRSKFEARIFATGKVLYNEAQTHLDHLISYAEQIVEQPFNPISEGHLNRIKYMLWNQFQKVSEMPVDATFFPLNYYNFINTLFFNYNLIIGSTFVLEDKLETYLTNEAFRKQYHMKAFPDTVFKDLFIKANSEVTKDNLIRLYSRFTSAVGSIDEDNFEFHF